MPDRIIRDELLESSRWVSLKDNADRLAYMALLLLADDYGNAEASLFILSRKWYDFGINSQEKVAHTLANLSDSDLIRMYDIDGKRYAHIPRFGQRLRYARAKHPLPPWQESREDVSTYEWRNKIRPTILQRDGNKCAECSATDELTVDHIIPVANGGKSTIDNLITLCRPCNMRKGVRVERTPHYQSLVAKRNIALMSTHGDVDLTVKYEEKRRDVEVKRREEKGVRDLPVDNSPATPEHPMAQAPKVKGNSDWWRSNDGIEAKGRELGIPAKRGEPWPEYKARLFAAMHVVAPIATGTGG